VEDNGRVVVITGAAGGMGAAIAHRLAQEGWSLVLGDLHATPLEAMAKTLGKTVSITIVAGDITDPDYPARLVAALGTRRADAMIHAAGVSPSMADGQRVFAINFTATDRLVKAITPAMARDSAIVLIASNSGHIFARAVIDGAVRKLLKGKKPLLARLMLHSPRTAYPLSKRAVQLYAQAMAPVLGEAAVRIVSLSPGIIDTEMGRLENDAGPEMQRMIKVTPLGRPGGANEIALVAAFLVSPAARYINGTDILVDGGMIAGIAAAGGVMKLH
jgi:NAD(P)-dependent dehydrogenase (short-subunit alcohol dehydrogenase family)